MSEIDLFSKLGGDFKEILPENLKVGDVITVSQWTSHKDGSYVGDVLVVKHIVLPFVFVENKYDYIGRIKLDCNRLKLAIVPDAYLEAFLWEKNK